jgi:3-hydroxyacyl-CoA dehydrogenase
VRDDLLGTTEAGREWIALFERVQGALIPIVLEDERLSDDAAALLERAGRIVEDEKATLTEDDAERALSLIRRLAERAESDDVRADLEAVSAALASMRDRTSGEAIETLMQRGPRGGYGTRQE